MKLKLYQKLIVSKLEFFFLIVIFTVLVGKAWGSESIDSQTIEAQGGLIGEWCYEKKRYVTVYHVKIGKLQIRSGRSGRTYEADLKCNDSYTECEAQTIRGWGSLVTETLRLDDAGMNLTRSWGGAWKGKTYHFKYKRCPKWR